MPTSIFKIFCTLSLYRWDEAYKENELLFYHYLNLRHHDLLATGKGHERSPGLLDIEEVARIPYFLIGIRFLELLEVGLVAPR